MDQNPLRQYFRQIKFYIRLPSGISYYPPGSIEFTDSGEVGIMPMTGKDEMVLKNPDALLNGEALIEVISSCVPSVKNPRVLLTNDIDALITAVRLATFNDSLETALRCQSCSHENSFKLDLRYALDNMEFLDPEYIVNLDSGVSIFVRPYTFPDILRTLHSQFEQSKITRALDNDSISDSQRTDIFSKAFKEMSSLTYELLVSSIIKIVDESKNINVSKKEFIKEFLFNIDKKSIDKISDTINHINNIGIRRTFLAKCTSCGHEWENDIDFNPVNFS